MSSLNKYLLHQLVFKLDDYLGRIQELEEGLDEEWPCSFEDYVNEEVSALIGTLLGTAPFEHAMITQTYLADMVTYSQSPCANPADKDKVAKLVITFANESIIFLMNNDLYLGDHSPFTTAVVKTNGICLLSTGMVLMEMKDAKL